MNTIVQVEVVDELTRRDFLAAMAAAGLAVACGSSEQPGEAAVGATRAVRSDNGVVEVPADPQRVVAAIGSFETDMVAVGIMPVLTTSFAGPWVDLDDSVTVTDNIPPTPEELLAVRPDLMVGWNWVTAEANFEAINAVAPYVGLGESPATAGPGADGSQPLRSWNTLFLSVCDVVGRRAQGEELLTAFEARLDDLAARRSGRGPVRVARVEFYDAGTFTYRGQVGLEVVGPATSERDVSLERLFVASQVW